MIRFYKDGEIEEIHNRFNNGGILWFIERTDTNQFLYIPLDIGLVRSESKRDIEWYDSIDKMVLLSGVFLTKKDAKKYSNLTEGGCTYCGHRSKKIPTIVTEHEFITTENN